MVIAPLSIRPDYWDTYSIQEEDLEYLYNHLLEIETPLTLDELTSALVNERIDREKKALQNHLLDEGKLYLPKEHYEINQVLTFPALGWKKGKVIGVRSGYNPELPAFDVIEVELEGDGKKTFAAGLEEHHLNRPIDVKVDDPLLDPQVVMQNYGRRLAGLLESELTSNPDLVRIAGRWFPRALLVDVNIGHLNLAEAVLDMAGGGPLPTAKLLDQIELPTDVNTKLTEFSLNLALQEDGRFDEVGLAGKILWFLKRLEPDAVHNPPVYLRYAPIQYDPSSLTPELVALEGELDDELSTSNQNGAAPNEVVVSLIFPHWRSGTLPLTKRMSRLFPTAYEAPRIQFTLVDGDTGDSFSGWVVREHRYVYGLREWYEAQGLIPGSTVHIRRGKQPGAVIVQVDKRRSAREWIRTVLVGADGGIVYALLKQVVTATFDERMAIYIPDIGSIDQVWEQSSHQRKSFQDIVVNTVRELAKSNPQGHVHAHELYAAVNMVRRCPPGPIFHELVTRPWFVHIGDLYFRLDEAVREEKPE
ncbi:MAG: hypothetical protein M1281_11600 [Chloroflexi bacterium]|nr:hypothetical protein [Chloroflexota bacterium]